MWFWGGFRFLLCWWWPIFKKCISQCNFPAIRRRRRVTRPQSLVAVAAGGAGGWLMWEVRLCLCYVYNNMCSVEYILILSFILVWLVSNWRKRHFPVCERVYMCFGVSAKCAGVLYVA